MYAGIHKQPQAVLMRHLGPALLTSLALCFASWLPFVWLSKSGSDVENRSLVFQTCEVLAVLFQMMFWIVAQRFGGAVELLRLVCTLCGRHSLCRITWKSGWLHLFIPPSHVSQHYHSTHRATPPARQRSGIGNMARRNHVAGTLFVHSGESTALAYP